MPFPVAAANMPSYRSHKIVRAAKIERMEWEAGSAVLITDHGRIPVEMAYMHKHDPKAGGYYVAYEDDAGGYESWSPAEAFEAGYTRI